MPTDFTPNGTTAHAPSSAPDLATAPVLREPTTTDPYSTTQWQQAIETLGEFITYLLMKGAFGYAFGDGSDGDATLDGTNTYSWATKVGSVYTLTQDVYLNNLTITGATTKLECHGYRIYVRGTLDVQHANARIQAPGKAGATGASQAYPPGTIAAGAPTSANGTNTVGTAGTADRGVGYSGNGGAGGAGSGGAGGAAGTCAAATAKYGGLGVYSPNWLGFLCGGGSAPLTGGVGVATALSGGASGGSGGGNGSTPGGNGGGGGGVIAIAARTIILASAANLSAPGGAGATGPANNLGGGGGGGGGTILLVYAKLQLGSGSLDAATCCPGGAGGAGGGGGLAGAAGANGAVFTRKLG
jgi:hypothetical protein